MHSTLNRGLPRRTFLAGSCTALLTPALLTPALLGCDAPVPTLRLGSIVFPGYEPLFVARDLGLVDAERVRLIELQATTDTLRALAANQLEAGAMTLDELMTARADGVDLRAVLVFDVSHGADVVLAKAPITLQTLAGKRVAVEDGAMGAVMLSALLKAAQLAPHHIQQVSMTLDRSEALFATNAVDVVVTAEPWATRLEKRGAQRIFDTTAIPGRIVDVLAVRAAVLQAQGPALRQLLIGFFAAQKLLLAQDSRALRLVAARLQTSAHEVLPLYRGLQLPDLAQNRAMLKPGGTVDQTTQSLQRLMVEAGLLRPAAVLQSLADDRFLPL